MAKFQLAILLVTISLAAAVPFNFDNLEVDDVEVDDVEFNDDLAMEYLATYGYVRADAMETFEEVMMKFQKAQGLETTGELDEATKALMKTPRCGMPDYKDGDLSQPYTTGGVKWNKRALTFSVEKYSGGGLTNTQVNTILLASLKLWGAESTLSFSRATSGGDIKVYFYNTRAHAGTCSFASTTLAHAAYPYKDTSRWFHFNEYDYTYAVKDGSSGTYALSGTATHEFGHNLGLGHSSVSTAIMYAYENGVLSLADDDIKGIKSLYY